MNASSVAKHYTNLTPEERFRLILAASGRGDEVERERLANAGGEIRRCMQDHAPYAHAFEELTVHVFMQLLEDAACYRDYFHWMDEAERGNDDEAEEEPEDQSSTKSDEEPAESADWGSTIWDRYFDLALASGFELRTTVEGWKLFCERLNIPPFLHWENLPGFHRLQRALALAEKAAFVPEGFLKWLNRIRPEGKPEMTAVPLTVEGVAAAFAEAFRKRIQWWGG